MLAFRSISWKNFLMTGNTPITYRCEGGTTLFVGKNGVGKSTILDALTFAWFGKSFREINKPTIVNSINQKECEVESVVERDGHVYRVLRGLKPTILRLWDNEVEIELPAGAYDAQRLVEEQYLRLDYKTFRHIVLLGAMTYTPFMRLPAAQRRLFVEDVLDIRIFSSMAVIAKDHLAQTLIHQKSLQGQQHSLKDRLAIIQKYEAQHVEAEETRLADLQTRIDDEQAVVQTLRTTLETLRTEQQHLQTQLPDLQAHVETYRVAQTARTEAQKRLGVLEKRITFYQTTSECSQCQQALDAAFTAKILEDFHTKRVRVTDTIQAQDQIMTTHQTAQAEVSKVETAIQSREIRLARTQTDIQTRTRQIGQWVKDQQTPRYVVDVTDRTLVESELSQLDAALRDTARERQQYELVTSLLKDDGIKTSVIRQYLPIINNRINHYLREFDFSVQFAFDETFAETFHSRYRDEFNYENFSEGQKRRIDIALLLAWRDVAKAKNNSATNLLILDEVFDSSLDTESMENLIAIIRKLETDTHVVLISHREVYLDKVSRVFSFENVKNFTHMSQRI